MKKALAPDYLYRESVGLFIVNKDGYIFVGKRIDTKSNSWQMPQGGVDCGENLKIAAFRELKEETGIDAEKVKLLKESKEFYYYNLPSFLRKKFWNGNFLGQKQKWFLFRFYGSDKDINLKAFHPEFKTWKWTDQKNMLQHVVSFKKEIYEDLVNEFSSFIDIK